MRGLLFLISLMPQEGNSSFSGEALKRVFLKVCNVFPVSKQHLIFIYPANVTYQAHTKYTHAHTLTLRSEKCSLKTEYITGPDCKIINVRIRI